MAKLTPSQRVWRGRIEGGLRLAAPFLDLVLAAGDRLSRMVEREELESGPGVPAVGRGRDRAASSIGGAPE